MLAKIADGAAYGFGASVGRDVYRKIKNGGVTFIVLFGMFLTAFGYRELVRGHDRGFLGTLFLTLFGSLAMIVLGTFPIIAVGIFVSALAAPSLQPSQQAGLTVFVMVTAHALLAFLGMGWGLVNRYSRWQARKVTAHNLHFMHNVGFRDPEIGQDVVEDGDGNRLRLRECTPTAIIFHAVGRRNVRASIKLDKSGRMTDYSGLVSLG